MAAELKVEHDDKAHKFYAIFEEGIAELSPVII